MRLCLVLAVIALAGCAGAPRRTCNETELVAAIDHSLDAGRRLDDSELTECTVAGESINSRWLARACTPDGGWRLGLAGAALPEACDTQDRWLNEGYRLGEAYVRIITRLNEPDRDPDAAAGLEKIRLTRERDAIRGVAQIKAWPLPDQSAMEHTH